MKRVGVAFVLASLWLQSTAALANPPATILLGTGAEANKPALGSIASSLHTNVMSTPSKGEVLDRIGGGGVV